MDKGEGGKERGGVLTQGGRNGNRFSPTFTMWVAGLTCAR